MQQQTNKLDGDKFAALASIAEERPPNTAVITRLKGSVKVLCINDPGAVLEGRVGGWVDIPGVLCWSPGQEAWELGGLARGSLLGRANGRRAFNNALIVSSVRGFRGVV